jgi:hypothetical protein
MRPSIWLQLRAAHRGSSLTTMWSLVVDKLLGELNEAGFYTVIHAYITILINGKFPLRYYKLSQD